MFLDPIQPFAVHVFIIFSILRFFVTQKDPSKKEQSRGQWLKVSLDTPTKICGIRVWNYSKSYEDTYRGTKWVKILANGVFVLALNKGVV